MKNFWRILRYLCNYKFATISVIGSNLLYALFSIISISSLAPVLNILFDSQNVITKVPIKNYDLLIDYNYYKEYLLYLISENIQSTGKIKTLIYICIFTIVIFFLKNIFNYLGSYFFADIRSGVAKTLRDQLHWKYLNLPISYYSERRKGDLVSRISTDVNEVEWTMLTSIVSIIRDPILFFGTLIVLFIVNYQLTMFVVVLLPVSGFIISTIGKRLRKDAKSVQLETGKLISLVEEALSGLKILKIFNSEKVLQSRFEHSSHSNRKYSKSVFRRKDLASPIGEFLGAITMIILLVFGGIQILEDKSLNPGVFLIYIGLFFQMIDPAKKISITYYEIQKGNAAAGRIFDVLDREVTLKDSYNANEVYSFNSEIVFNNVSFAYESKMILEDINLTVKKGEMLAIVGESGAGKSTIVNLLSRFYDVNKGKITLDGVDIRNIKLHSYRDLIGVITQDSILFNTSIIENILIGKQNATQDEIIHAAKVAHAHEFISKLPYGYQTNVGDSGNKLSGGQKQRICIARAILKNPPILIMDEATSALDTQSEKYVQEAIEKIMYNRTSIVIAHRLSTIKGADKILVVNKGKIIEEGTHKELIKKNGDFKKLLELQNFK